MLPSTSDAYLETQVLTATPQRLRLMLIEGAIRRAHGAQIALAEGNTLQVFGDLGRCRDIVAELMAGINPNQSPLNRQILAVYSYLYSTLVDIAVSPDASRLSDVLRVLEEERQTWRELCEKMPDRIVPDA